MYARKKTLRDLRIESLEEEVKGLVDVRGLREYLDRRHLAIVSRPFIATLDAMMKPIRQGRKWTDREELRMRHFKRGTRMRRLMPEDRLDNPDVLLAIRTRIEALIDAGHLSRSALDLLDALDRVDLQRRTG